MIEITIKNLKFKNYFIDLMINQSDAIGFWAYDRTIISDFFSIIAGINRNKNTCMFHEKNIFDNKEYFNSRLYLDYSHRYLSTCKTKGLAECFKQNYSVDINISEFKNVLESLDIRGETELGRFNRFTDTGNTFINFALTRAINKKIIIINNPTSNISLASDINTIASGLIDKERFHIMLIAPDQFNLFAGLFDRVIYFSNYNNNIIVAKRNDSLVYIETKDLNLDEVNEDDIIHYDKNGVILINRFSRGEIRNLNRAVGCKQITLYEIDDYVIGSRYHD